PGETGLTGNIYVGLQEYEEMAFILQALRAGDLFIDVGANSGAYTILACGAVGCDAYAFEPVPETFARLTENVRLNAIDGRVRCTGRAVGSTAGTLTMTSRRDTSNHILGDDESATMSVPVEVCTL